MSDEKVLLVDDELEFTALLSERMEARGLKVETTASGAGALQKTKENNFDVIVLDLSMPGMDGIETLRRLLADHPDLQVILLTGKATLQKGIEAVKLGAREVLEKPTDLNALLAKIAEAKKDKVMLVQKRMEEQMKSILGTKGW